MSTLRRDIRRLPSGGVVELGVDPCYVSARGMRFGAVWLEPGDRVPIEAGRDYAALVSRGVIVQVIEPNE